MAIIMCFYHGLKTKNIFFKFTDVENLFKDVSKQMNV